MRALAAGAIVGAFLTACTPGPRSASGFRLPQGDAEHGRAAFVELRCHACHRVEGVSMPEPVAVPPVPVVLGGTVFRPRTDGELVSAIVNPSHRIVPREPADLVRSGQLSRMGDFSESMSVRQLVDLVAFLQSTYVVVRPPPPPLGAASAGTVRPLPSEGARHP
jgi:hypothetical protein